MDRFDGNFNSEPDFTNKISPQKISAFINSNSPKITMFNLPAGRKLLDGQYTIDRYLGAGGLGVTYLVKNRNGKLFVLKTIQDKYKSLEKFRMDFDREARKLSQCKGHPNIVKIVRYFTEDIEEAGLNGWSFILMEYVKGQNLKEFIDNRNSPLPETEAINYIQQIGRALVGVIHAKGLVHRDIKPDNIILKDGVNQPVLIDFGLTREFSMSDPKTRTSFISSGYSGIEQLKPKKYQVSKNPFFMDIYSLAATLYFLLTKTNPSNVVDREESLRENKKDSLVPPNQINNKISDFVNKAILKGMSFEPKDRPQTVDSFLDLLNLKSDNSVDSTRKISYEPPIVGAEINTDILKEQANIRNSIPTKPANHKSPNHKPIRRNIWLAVPASILLGLSAFWAMPKSSSLNATYESEQYGFGFKYPSSWDKGKIESPSGAASDIVAEFAIPNNSSQKDNAKLIASVEELNSFNVSLDNYVNDIKQQLNSNSVQQIVGEVEILPAPKNNFRQINYVMEENGQQVERTELVGIDDGRAYTLAYEASTEHFEKLYKTVSKVFDSFTVLD